MNHKLKFVLFAIPFILVACMPEDVPVSPFDRGNAIISQIVLESDYKWQSFFNLSENRELKRSLMNEWDLAFSCSDSSYTVLVNTATFMQIEDKGNVAFEDISSVKNPVFRAESPDGYDDIDSTAIRQWYDIVNNKVVSKNHVYIVNMGVTSIGRPLGNKKMMIIRADEIEYEIRVSDLNGKNDRNIIVKRNPNLNYVCISLKNDEVFDFEPQSETWDLLFTKYTFSFYEPEYIPYSVTGVLINPKYVVAAVDTVHSYSEITSDLIDSYQFSNKMDIIGYDWKKVDIETSVYTIYPNINYIIRDIKGFYYKLHFIDYYDDEGKKGAPKFEFQKL